MDQGPLKSTGSQLKSMLQKTGRPALRGASEKLDLLLAITEHIKEQVERRNTMSLTLDELDAFLQFEGLTPSGDAKVALLLLWELRRLQIARLGMNYIGARAATDDECWLVEIDAAQVSQCFAMVEVPPPAVDKQHITFGSRIEICGLVNASELNGKFGIVACYDEGTQRYFVNLEGVDKPKKLKRANLIEVASTPVTKGAQGYPQSNDENSKPMDATASPVRMPAPPAAAEKAASEEVASAKFAAEKAMADSATADTVPAIEKTAAKQAGAQVAAAAAAEEAAAKSELAKNAPVEKATGKGVFKIADSVRVGGLKEEGGRNGTKAVVFGVDGSSEPFKYFVVFEDNHFKKVKLKACNLTYLGSSTGILASKARMEAAQHQ